MNYIVGDIGNTSTRICLLNKKFTIIKSYIFDTKKIFEKRYFKNIIGKLSKKKVSSKILLSSVVPLGFREIKKNFKNSKYKIVEVKSLDSNYFRHNQKWRIRRRSNCSRS